MIPLPWAGGSLTSLIFMSASLALIAFSVLTPSGLDTMRMAVSDTVAPIFRAVSKPAQDAALFVRNVSGLAQLQAENTRLAEENEKLREWYQTALVLESENKSLRDLLNVKLEHFNKYITTRIVADFGGAFVKSFLVSSGERDGVHKGQAVISSDGLVGRITEVGENTSRVLLVTDINSRVPVLVENSSQHAVMAGGNDANPRLTHLPVGSELEEGSRIITSGHGGVFPMGLPVGRVVYSQSGEPQVKLFAKFDRIVYVRIVDKADNGLFESR
ncbi:MAG: rod shape-determining protein MreC [Alphaproteobacteria bacterium]|nr:rod shape-determining protein MreC [Alphaproteobacteria bacterium]